MLNNSKERKKQFLAVEIFSDKNCEIKDGHDFIKRQLYFFVIYYIISQKEKSVKK